LNNSDIKRFKEKYIEIKNGLWVLHTCDNKKCVNPKHLYLGDVKQNVKDAVERNRWARQDGQHNGMSKITFKQAQEIREIYRNKEKITYKNLSEMYGITQSQISDIVNNKSYRRE